MGKGDVKGKGKMWFKIEYSKAQFMVHIRYLKRKGRGWEAELKRKRKSTKLPNSNVPPKIQTNEKCKHPYKKQISIKIQTSKKK
jgi:hypothetical protein